MPEPTPARRRQPPPAPRVRRRRRRRGAAGFAGGIGHGARDRRPGRRPGVDRYPFHGEHQAGIVTPAQDRLHFAAFDVTADLARRAAAAAQGLDRGRRRDDRRAGRSAAAPPLPYDAPPADTGEATRAAAGAADADLRLRPVAVPRRRRQGPLRPRRPAARGAAPAAALPGRQPRAGSAATATSACRPAPTTRRSPCTRSATCPGSPSARAALRWSQLGFGRTSSTSTPQATPRNLFGFKDGTANLKAEEPDERRRARVGRRRRRRRRRLAGRRLLPRRPPDQHAHRDLGPHLAARAGAR